MSATRTQIYFPAELRERIDRAASAEGITMAEFVRRAVDEFLGGDVDPTEALTATFGTVPDASAPSRDDWRRG